MGSRGVVVGVELRGIVRTIFLRFFGGPVSSSTEEANADKPLNSGVGEGSEEGGKEDNGVDSELRRSQPNDCDADEEKGLGVLESVLNSELASSIESSSNKVIVATSSLSWAVLQDLGRVSEAVRSGRVRDVL